MSGDARIDESSSCPRSRILLVDASEPSRVALARRLASLGFAVDTAADGVDGAASALRNPPSAVISDLWMPGVSGIQLCRLLRAEAATSTIPVLLRGDESDRRNRFWAEHAGAFALLDKGRVGELVRSVRRAITEAPPRNDFFLQVDGASIRDRIARHLDEALFASVLSAEVRAFASCDSIDRLFDQLAQLVAQVCAYRWMGLRAAATGFLGVHHRLGEGDLALPEARAALGDGEGTPFVLEDGDAATGSPLVEPIVEPIHFGDREVGALAIGPRPEDEREARTLARLVARELGGPLRMTALVDETRKLATTDSLTRLWNRRALIDWAEREMARSDRHHAPFALVLLDVDHFKLVNDWFGHGNGDRVLVEVAQTVRGALRTSDVAARWGGEEVLVALPNTDGDGAMAVAERLRTAIAAASVPVDGAPPITVTASLGVATRQPRESLTALLERADAALYAAKHSGRNRTVSGDPPPDRPARERRTTSSSALAPILRSASSRPAEALEKLS